MTATISQRMSIVHAALVVALSACVCWLTLCAPAWAQKGNRGAAILGKIQEVKKIVRAGDIPPDQKKFFDDFLTKEFLPLFVTPVEKYSLDDLPRLRKELRLICLSNKSGPAHDRVNQLTLAKMTDIVKNGKYGEYDAAIKFNAMLVIGDLNEQEADPTKPAKPMAEVFPFLLEQFKSPGVKDYLKLAVLLGLDRLASVNGIPQAKAAETTKLLVDLVNQQQSPAGRDPAAHDFMRRDAGQVLATMGSPGPGNSVLKALVAMAVDPKVRPTIRCDVVQFIGQLKLPPAAKVDPQQLANTLGHQWVDLCKQEIQAADDADRPAERRLILCSTVNTNGVLTALKTAAAGTGATEKFIDNIKAKLKAVYNELVKEELDDSDVSEKLGSKISDVEEILATADAGRKDALMASEGKEKRVDPAKQ